MVRKEIDHESHERGIGRPGLLRGGYVNPAPGNRPYRKGLPMEAIIREYKKHGGTQFDPDLAVKFVEMLERDEELLKGEI